MITRTAAYRRVSWMAEVAPKTIINDQHAIARTPSEESAFHPRRGMSPTTIVCSKTTLFSTWKFDGAEFTAHFQSKMVSVNVSYAIPI